MEFVVIWTKFLAEVKFTHLYDRLRLVSGDSGEWKRPKRKLQMCWHSGNCPSRYSCVAFFCVWVGPNDIANVDDKPVNEKSIMSTKKPNNIFNIEDRSAIGKPTRKPYGVFNIGDKTFLTNLTRSTRIPRV
ncbi:hypothetical protein FO519_006107 [Halicephalobus sp. NKZ332]|nr:hypothetical protein FO519_006107 [Halicephalobus sp. NKZ332]